MRAHLVALAVTACTGTPELDLSESTAAASNCTGGGCGDNGAVVDGSDISWFRLDHVPYKDVQYLHFALSQHDMDNGIHADNLDVTRNRLRYGQPGAWHVGSDLEHTVIRVSAEGRVYDVEITEVHHDTPYWTELPSGFAESYRFTWTAKEPLEPDRERGELCPTDVRADPLWNHAFTAVVFEGEKYDDLTRDIRLTGAEMYVAPFNIACFGSLPAKQELSRRTSATVEGIYTTTIDDDRQNLARAWAAEYCGGGHSFTHQGHKLRIRDRHEWLFKAGLGWSSSQASASDFHYEAVWADGRAVCLDTPRLAVQDARVPPDERIFDRIVAECGELPPPCTDQPWFPADWKSRGDFLTATIGEQVVFR
jgi:hypothetical protein